MNCRTEILIILVLLTSTCFANSQDICSQYNAALDLYRAGEVSKAQDKWQELLRVHRDRLSPQQVKSLRQRLNLAKKCLSLSSGEALNYINRATKIIQSIESNPEASGREKRKQLGQAQMLLDFAASNKKVMKRRLRVQADVYKMMGDEKSERQTIENLLKHSPSDQTGNYRLAKMLLRQKTRKATEEAFERAKLAVGEDKRMANEFAELFPSHARKEHFSRMATEIAIRKARQPSEGSKYIMTSKKDDSAKGTSFKDMDSEAKQYEHKTKYSNKRSTKSNKSSSQSVKEPGGSTASKYSVTAKGGFNLSIFSKNKTSSKTCRPSG